MKASIYLVIAGRCDRPNVANPQVYCGSVQAKKTKPRTASNEVAIKLDIEIPDALFMRPAMLATISIPEGSTLSSVLTATVKNDIAAALKKQAGVNITITAEE